jgi:hypothetical protein
MWRWLFGYGIILGSGVLTRLVTTTVYVLLGFAVLVGSFQAVLICWVAFALGRFAPVCFLSRLADIELAAKIIDESRNRVTLTRWFNGILVLGVGLVAATGP